MGLVTCEKCKKIYDYETHNGICPKCARYNRETSAATEHQEYHDKYDGGYNHSAQDDHHSYHQKYDDNKNPHSGQLAGTQMTLREVMGAEHKVNLEAQNGNKKKADKTTKLVLGIIFGIVAINIFLTGGIILVPIVIGILLYLARKKK